MRSARGLVVALVLAALTIDSHPAPAQSLGSLRKKADEAKKKAAAAVDSKKASADSVKAKAGVPAQPPNATATPAAAATPPAAASGAGTGEPPADATKPNAKVWENYDFVPGNTVLFYTDFSEDKVGNFARGLKYRRGPVEVVERDGIKVLRATGDGEFLIPVGKKLPERFTLEVDVISPLGGLMNRALTFEGGATSLADDKSAWITWNPHGAWIQGSGLDMSSSGVKAPDASVFAGHVTHIRVLMDSAYFKMYANERRLYNIPELAFKRDSVIRISLAGTEGDGMAVYVTSIRVAESETDVLYDALAAKGRWVTQGILFATGKADVQPESRPVLKEIAATLKQHADLAILIEGHTDNVGSAASNLTLSDARAAAVKAVLVSEYGADGARITTKGLGDTKPAVPNTTAAGRAQNRRVEVVKQ